MTDYTTNDVCNILKNIKNNPYGIKHVPHYVNRANKRSVDLNVVTEKLNTEYPVGIQKTLYYSNRFELIYEFNKTQDLYIIIDITNTNEITIITVIFKKNIRRDHS